MIMYIVNSYFQNPNRSNFLLVVLFASEDEPWISADFTLSWTIAKEVETEGCSLLQQRKILELYSSLPSFFTAKSDWLSPRSWFYCHAKMLVSVFLTRLGHEVVTSKQLSTLLSLRSHTIYQQSENRLIPLRSISQDIHIEAYQLKLELSTNISISRVSARASTSRPRRKSLFSNARTLKNSK